MWGRRYAAAVAVASLSFLCVPSVAQARPEQPVGWVGGDVSIVAQDEQLPPRVGEGGVRDGVDKSDVVEQDEVAPKAPHVEMKREHMVTYDKLPQHKPYIPPQEVTVDEGGSDGGGTSGSADMGGSDGSGAGISSSEGDSAADESLGGSETDVENIQQKVDKNVKGEGKKYITALDWFAAQQDGAGYFWGGPKGKPGQSGDCSGFMGQLVAIAYGKDPWTRLFATMNEKDVLSKLGLEIRPGGSEVKLGEFATGWYNGGNGGGHTAGTLPSGVNVESGGNSASVSGTGASINMYGRVAVPANDKQFVEGLAVIPWSHFEKEKDKLKFGEISWNNADWRCAGSGADNPDNAEEKSKGKCSK